MTIDKIVSQVISQVRRNGDRALIKITKKFDKVSLTEKTLRVSPARIKGALKRISSKEKTALKACAARVADFHKEEKKRMPTSWSITRKGVKLGQVIRPMDSVGIYVPGGRFAYPSTVLMTAIPAKLAGVKRRVIVTPPGRLSDTILAAAAIAGVDEIYQVGGPAAIAALALGTKQIQKVDFIIGPGNAFVTEAKRQLFGVVGIDLLAGPSELVVIADKTANPEWVAADMAAQAEHDPDARSFVLSHDLKFLQKVQKLIPRELRKRCVICCMGSLKDSIDYANHIAGEHVEVFVKNPQTVLKKINHGGAVFVGDYSPAVLGDYWAGPSHVLPTGRSARFASGLSVATFLKRSSLTHVTKKAFAKGWKAPHHIAELEGLRNHARALKIRMDGKS